MWKAVRDNGRNWQVAVSAYTFWSVHRRYRDTVAIGEWILDHRRQFTEPGPMPGEQAAAIAMAVAALIFDEQSPGAALPFAELAYELDPRSPATANDLAWTLVEAGADPRRALPLAKQAVRGARPAERAAYMDTLGWTYYKLGRTSDAVYWLEKAARAGPNEPELRAHLAAAELRSGNIPRAYIEAQKALILYPGNKEALEIAVNIKKTRRYDPPGPL